MQSGLGKLILKEEKEQQQFQERHTRSLSAQRQTNGNTGAYSASPLLLHFQIQTKFNLYYQNQTLYPAQYPNTLHS